MRNRNRKFIWPVVLGIFICITAPRTTVNAQGTHTSTDSSGNSTTAEPSNEYGEGGTHEIKSDKDFRPILEGYWDKCGQVREYYRWNPKDKQGTKSYFGEKGEHIITVVTDKNGQTDHYENLDGEHYGGEDVKARVEARLKKITRSRLTPCPEKTAVAPGPSVTPKPHPNPLGGILQGVSIGIGGGRTVSHDDHKGDHRVSDHKRSGSTTKKLPAGCKCHPCTCSPCRCGG